MLYITLERLQFPFCKSEIINVIFKKYFLGTFPPPAFTGEGTSRQKGCVLQIFSHCLLLWKFSYSIQCRSQPVVCPWAMLGTWELLPSQSHTSQLCLWQTQFMGEVAPHPEGVLCMPSPSSEHTNTQTKQSY